MTTRNRTFLTLAVVAMAMFGLVAATAQATIISSANKSDSAQTVSATDLLQTNYGSTPTYNFNKFAETVGRDGAFAATPIDDYMNGNIGNVVEWEFDTGVNTAGYDITDINTYAYHESASAGGRSEQAYQVDISFVAAPTTFFSLIPGDDWTQVLGSSAAQFTAVTHSNSGGGVLDNGTVTATGVKRIRFTVISTDDGLNPNRYREFDIIGAASIPEPSTFALAALGLLSLGLVSSELLIWANGIAWENRCFVVWRKELRDWVGEWAYWPSGK